MRRRLGLSAGMAVLAAWVGLGLTAADDTVAQGGVRQSAEVRFVEQRPGVPTALTFTVDYVNPADPAAKPHAVRTVVETLAQGARFDTSVPEQCLASDAQLIAQGASACPPASRVGAGSIRIDSGFPEPNRFTDVDVIFFNNENQLIFLNTIRGTSARVVARGTIKAGTLMTSAPPLPGTPPDGGAIDRVETKLDAISKNVDGETRAYITTPPDCPPGERWVNTLSFTYADGVTQSVDSPSPCRGGGDVDVRGRCANAWKGSAGSDRHLGTTRGDRLHGLGGADRLRGRRGGDCVRGDAGADLLRGGSGADRLNGGRGIDTCRGGRGRDRLRGCEVIESR